MQTLNGFELLRFDIMLSEDLRPTVIDIVMSPRFYNEDIQQEHFRIHYQHLLYNTFNLIGLGANPMVEANG